MSADTVSSTITARVVQHHNAAMSERNIDDVMSDYADDAVLIDPSGISRGKAAIRRVFERLLASGVPMAPPTQQVFEGQLAYLVWNTPLNQPGRQGAETLLVRHGKIIAQTVAALGPPPPHRESGAQIAARPEDSSDRDPG
jgi:ketosteroid isomerase-like protein